MNLNIHQRINANAQFTCERGINAFVVDMNAHLRNCGTHPLADTNAKAVQLLRKVTMYNDSSHRWITASKAMRKAYALIGVGRFLKCE